MPIEVQKLPEYDILYNLPAGTNTVILIGGRGGAKTYEGSKFVAFSATIKRKRCVILRDEKELIRESILNEVLQRYDTANTNGALSTNFVRLDTGIKDRDTGDMLVFTKGFRASSLQKSANLKGVSDIDIAVIEEAEDIRDVDKFNTFSDSIRKEGALIIIILNTPDINHWIIKRYFNLTPAKNESGIIVDGFFQISPKVLPGFVCIQTSFENNPHLPEHIVTRYRGYGDPQSHLYNPYYYFTAIKGWASTGRKGQVIKHAKPIKLAEYMDLPYKEIFGQDFGTASPAGLVGAKLFKNKIYARQISYRPMSTLEIGKLYCTLGFTIADRIVADYADEKACKKLKNGFQRIELSDEDLKNFPHLVRGFHVVECTKGRDSIRDGISLLEGMELFIVEESTNFWEEILNYVYAQDKNGNYTDDPIDDYNHLIDPLRYIITDQRGGKSTKWGYSV